VSARRPRKTVPFGWLIGVLVLAYGGQVRAGTISIAWDPVEDTDLAGYRVYYGMASGSYSQSVDVGNVLETTLTGLSDCTTWYVAVKAYDTAGNLSEGYSNEVSGWPRPIVRAASPASAEQGRTLDVVLDGSNFQPGATVRFLAAGIVVNSVTVESCSRIRANVTVGGSAAVGASDVEVTNPDQVFGTGAGIFTVEAAVAPTVTSTDPADGASGVAVTVRPTVTFSEPMLASSVSSSTVRLLDAQGASVAQAPGSPSLSTDGRIATISPASSLAADRTYKIQVLGGTGGVLDLAGHPMASTYAQATGFRTAADTAPPTLSPLTITEVGATTARIAWTTDEPADSQVFYRKRGETAYQATPLDSSLVTSHVVNLQGLEPATTYELHARSADPSGNAAESSPDDTLVTAASSFLYLRFEAEAGELESPVRVMNGPGAFGGAWIETPAGTPTGSASAPAGRASYGFYVPYAGTWKVWVRLYGGTTSSDSWFESVDGAARQPIYPPATGVWSWVAGRSYSLAAGLHTFELAGREAEARADRVLITDDPTFVPTEQAVGDLDPPGPVVSFRATPADRAVSLEWTNPADGDFAKTVIRYRTDGKFPVSPVDGYPVTEQAGAPGAPGSFLHTGLSNGTRYSYSAFAVDRSGNASPEATAEATPADLFPPGRVQNVRRKDKKGT